MRSEPEPAGRDCDGAEGVQEPTGQRRGIDHAYLVDCLDGMMQAKAAMTSSSVTVTASPWIDHVGRSRVGGVTFHPSAIRAWTAPWTERGSVALLSSNALLHELGSGFFSLRTSAGGVIGGAERRFAKIFQFKQ